MPGVCVALSYLPYDDTYEANDNSHITTKKASISQHTHLNVAV